MGRKKAEFKNLGTLPSVTGAWRVTQAASGAIILMCGAIDPIVIHEGKMATLNESMKGKADANEES